VATWTAVIGQGHRRCGWIHGCEPPCAHEGRTSFSPDKTSSEMSNCDPHSTGSRPTWLGCRRCEWRIAARLIASRLRRNEIEFSHRRSYVCICLDDRYTTSDVVPTR